MLARVNVKMSKMESALRSISILITDYTQSDEAAVWPFVTVPNWQIRAISTQEMSKAVVLGMSPLVLVEDIRLWEEYSLYSYQNWIGDTLDQQEKLLQQINLLSSGQMQQYTQIWEDEIAKEHLSIPEYVYQISPKFGPYVPNTDELNTNRGFVMPTWELAPAPRHNLTIVNYNLLNHTVIANAVEQLLQTRQPVLTPAFPDIHWLWKGAVAPGGIQSDIIAKNSGQFQPCSLLLQPIFEAIPKNDVENSLVLDPEQQQQQQQQQQHGGVSSPKLVGIAYALIPWSVYMEQNLADQTMRGVHAVLDWKPASEGCYESNRISSGSTPPDESTIHPVFTYRIDGKHAAFVGYGDLHESRYEYMMESMDFHFPTDPRQRPANASECAYGHYQWRVYPTEDMKETNFNPSNVGPWMYAMGVVAIFCVAGGIFLSYDYLVQLRQQAVLDTAIRSNAIVSSLFPSNVRDRIMKDAEEQAKQEARQRKLERKQRKKKKRRKKKAAQAADQVTNETDSLGMPKHQLKDFLNEVTNGGGVNSDDLGYGEAQPSVHVPEPPAAFGRYVFTLFPVVPLLIFGVLS